MDLHLSDKVALITGASRGIGLAVARTLAREGMALGLCARQPEPLAAAAAALVAETGARVFAWPADLTRPEAAEAFAAAASAALGGVDVLVNSAGAAPFGTYDEVSAHTFAEAIEKKYLTYVYAIKAVVPYIERRGGGAVVNVIGTGGKVPSPVHLPGGAANAALMLLTVGLAGELGPKGIRINAVNPGMTETERMGQQLTVLARAQGKSEAEVAAGIAAAFPLGRWGRADEVADVVAFLASARASFVNGAVVPVDGGRARAL